MVFGLNHVAGFLEAMSGLTETWLWRLQEIAVGMGVITPDTEYLAQKLTKLFAEQNWFSTKKGIYRSLQWVDSARVGWYAKMALSVSSSGVVWKCPVDGGKAVAVKEVRCTRKLIAHLRNPAALSTCTGYKTDRGTSRLFNDVHDALELLREVQVLLQLPRHPCVVDFIGVTFFPSRRKSCQTSNMCILMEFVEGGTLASALYDDEGRISPEEYSKIALQVACGLDHLHEHRVLHLDLKPANILLRRTQLGILNVKIGDFGSAISLDQLDSAKEMQGGEGSPAYMPPEAVCFDVNQPLDPRTYLSPAYDVYSFGILLWTMRTREKPYNNLRARDVLPLVARNNTRPSPIPRSWKTRSDARFFPKLMSVCWHASPDRRPKFSEIRKLLQRRM